MQIKTAPFAKAIEIASRTIEKRNTIPILGTALVEPSPGNDVIRVYGTDLDVEIMACMPHDGTPFAPFTMHTPTAFARLFRAGSDTMELVDNGGGEKDREIEIKAGRLSGAIARPIPAGDFPKQHYETKGFFSAHANLDAIDMILRVAGAISTEDARYYLNGVYFHHVEGWTYKAVATDGHRLYMGTIELPDASGVGIEKHGAGSDGIIIPKKWINLLRKERPRMNPNEEIVLFGASGGPLPNQDKDLAPSGLPRGAMSKAAISFHNGETPVTMISKLIDGTFPDYTRVVPNYGDDVPQVRVDRLELARALDAITAGVSEKTKAIKLTFDPKGKLVVSCKWIDSGFDGKISINAKTRVDQPFEIGYNAKYLRGICDVSGGEDLAITTADNGSPGSIVSPDATSFRTVLMPMRI